MHENVVQLIVGKALQFRSAYDSCTCLSRIDLFNRNSAFCGKIFDCVIPLGNDSNALGNSFGCDGMISCEVLQIQIVFRYANQIKNELIKLLIFVTKSFVKH